MQVKYSLTGFLLEDIATYCGFAGVPKELYEHMGLGRMNRSTTVAVLDRNEARRAMAFCFYLLGKDFTGSGGFLPLRRS